MLNKRHIGLLCGGPSPERGISLNSARSVMDHLIADDVQVSAFYVDRNKRFWPISLAQLYCNTPSDFDFKLQGEPLEDPRTALAALDLIFPLIHGAFGEDGELQALLEQWQLPFVGSPSQACRRMYPKDVMRQELQDLGLPVWPQWIVSPDSVSTFFARYSEGIVKPVCGGSSIGVVHVRNPQEALAAAQGRCVIEPVMRGKEFTIVVLQGEALVPTEIEIDGIQDFRAKYLPTNRVFCHTPARFPFAQIQELAETLFRHFGARDFARFDGWLVGETIYFTDLNPISGLEQNSFFFRQAAACGMSHREALRIMCRLPPEPPRLEEAKRKVFVLLGGETAERQVSLMSGTNVWLKLQRSKRYEPLPFVLCSDGIAPLPYTAALHHTVEEINHHPKEQPKLSLQEFCQRAKEQKAFVFLALHGGKGEDGSLQSELDEQDLPYNGCCPKGSRLGMDKWATARVISALGHPDLQALEKTTLDQPLFPFPLIIKPRADGCSCGVVVVRSQEEIAKYQSFIGQKEIPANSFQGQPTPIEMPQGPCEFLVEPYLEPDRIRIEDEKLYLEPRHGWVELTIGVVGGKALLPSITVASDAVLSVEEKFQGGTGINITPPPEEIIPKEAVAHIQNLAELCASALHLRNYARIDLFYHRLTQRVVVLEANTLPALTPSTVLYHQALAVQPPLYPLEFLERLIDAKIAERF